MAVWPSHVGIVFEDLDKALPFYLDTLGFKVVREVEAIPSPDRPAAQKHLAGLHIRLKWIRLGDCQLEVIDYVNKKDRKVNMGAMDVNAAHVGFYTRDIQRHYDRIKAEGAWFRSPPIFWGPQRATTYGKDPDGNWFQLIIPPADIPKGNVPLNQDGWGFAHYGIVVNRMEDALPFYRDLMGMEVVKVQEKRPDAASKGTHLDGVSLTEIWVRKGNFIIELVDFHNKKDVRLDMRCTDVHSLHVAFFADNVQEEHKRLASHGVWFRDQPYDLQGNPARFMYGKDPDGNWFEIIAPTGDAGDLPRPA